MTAPLPNARQQVWDIRLGSDIEKRVIWISFCITGELLGVLQLHDGKNLPKVVNIKKLLNEIEHKEIIQTPMFIVDWFQPALKQLDMTDDQLVRLYTELSPTPKRVEKMFKFQEVWNTDEASSEKWPTKIARRAALLHWTWPANK